MINTKAEFYQGSQGKLFRLLRTPISVVGHMIFVAPLFEEANRTRHMVTRASIDAYKLGYQSIIFDHFGTGDSEGELLCATLTCWQQDLLQQIGDIKAKSNMPITLSVQLSAALLLNNKIITHVDNLHLWQPQFNGKRFVQQFKRLSFASVLTNSNSEQPKEAGLPQKQTISGYTMSCQLLDDLAMQSIQCISGGGIHFQWFEWLRPGNKLSKERTNQQEQFKMIATKSSMVFHTLTDNKFWQMTELVLSDQLLMLLHNTIEQQKLALSTVSDKGIAND